jgi:hypothetical protein
MLSMGCAHPTCVGWVCTLLMRCLMASAGLLLPSALTAGHAPLPCSVVVLRAKCSCPRMWMEVAGLNKRSALGLELIGNCWALDKRCPLCHQGDTYTHAHSFNPSSSSSLRPG